MNKHVVFGKTAEKKRKQLIGKNAQTLAMASMAALLTACFEEDATPSPTPTPTSSSTSTTTTSSAITGKIYELTIGRDTLQGTDGDDKFIANLLGGIETFTTGETLDGGDGVDTLLVATSVAEFDTSIANVVNIEILEVRNGGNITSVDGDDDGYTNVTLDKLTADTVIKGIAATASVSVDDLRTNLLTIDFSAATGSADVANITIATASSGAGIDADDSEVINLTITDVATIDTANDFAKASKINIDAAKTTIIDLSGATATNAAVTVKGAGGVTLGALSSTIATVDASANSGGVKVKTNAATTSVTGGSGADGIEAVVPTTTLAIAAGAGGDTVDISAMDLTAALVVAGAKVTSVDGGSGKDTLVIAGGDLTNTNVIANVNKVTSFEVLQVDTAITAFSSDPFTGIDEFIFTADTSDAGNVNYGTVNANVFTLTATSASNTTIFAPVVNGGADIVTLNLIVSSADRTQNDINVTNIETVNIASFDISTSTAEKNKITKLTVSNGTKIVISGNADLELTSIDTGTGITVDASTLTGSLNVTATTGADTITGGSGGDIIRGGTGIDTIDLGDDTAKDAVILDDDTAGNHSVVSNFKVAIDVIAIDETEFATIDFAATAPIAALAAADYNEITTGGTLVADHVNIITTSSGYADYDAAFAAVNGSGADEVLVGFLNSTSGKFEIYFDADGSDNAGEVLIAQIDIAGADIASLSEANFALL